MERVYYSLMNQTLENPIGTTYVYSDLSFITLMYVVGQLAIDFNYISPSDLLPSCNFQGPWISQCYFEAYIRKYVFEEINMLNSSFLPAPHTWGYSAPCENDTITKTYQNILLQGQVSDGNAYAMGGIAGHAGIFLTARDLMTLGHRIMFAEDYGDGLFLNQTTTNYFTTEYNHTQSCRALGWSTNDPGAVDEGWSLSCGNFSAKTWTHIGYTGTQICGDPQTEIISVFLTNRVYPIAKNDQMNSARRSFNNAVLQALGLPNQLPPNSLVSVSSLSSLD